MLAGTEDEAVLQLNPTECTPTEQPGGALLPGLKVTERAPPHWEFLTTLPPEEQEWVSRQVEPSGMLYSHSTSASLLVLISISSIEKRSSSFSQLIEGCSSRLPWMHLLCGSQHLCRISKQNRSNEQSR